MKIRENLASMAAAMVVVAALAPATAAQAQSNEEKLRSMAQFYGVATYALGANERCDLLDAGEYRALMALRDTLSGDLSRATTKEVFASLDHAARAQAEWKACLSPRAHRQSWTHIENARLIAHAIQAAPATMSGDPGECQIGMIDKLSRSDWTIVADIAARRHAGPNRASFDAMQKMFAGLVDTECARAGKESRLMQAGFDLLWHAEDNARADGGDGTGKSPGSTLAGKYRPIIIASEMGPWRLRRGGFTGSLGRDGINTYRLVERGDADTAFITLTNPGLFRDPNGRLLFSQKGRWTIRLKGNAPGVQLRLGDGTIIPFSKRSGSGSPGLGSSLFDMPKAALAPLSGKADATDVQVAWQDDAGKWALFQGVGRNPKPVTFTLGQLREAIAWSTVPRPE
ncbi:MAG: hypothetical protein U0S50_03145 [Sphingopyxis sp.]|uniref:hypothetical protein n=1 Tax=Sphingopyxis sp. TaxID=1908224 RepID=UPI002ABA0E93|nr:hypothetical protein [Sphingopyxis sp.]MDZ3830799.1 hypothetical protein [Sphingopyxis sp.]